MSLTGGDYILLLTVYIPGSIDNIHYISLQQSITVKKHKMPDYVNNNISDTSQLLGGIPGTRYQERKMTGKQNNEKIIKNNVTKHTCAQVAGRVLRGQGCCLLVIRSVL